MFVNELFLIDNSPSPNLEFESFGVSYIFCGKNIGYGAAHNIGMRKSLLQDNIFYHLVVNPDIELAEDVIGKLVLFMEKNPKIANVMPKVVYPDGRLQYLCKLIPTPVDLILKRFLSKELHEERINKFQLKFTAYDKVMSVPYLSGCFMFLRVNALRKVGLFDERFFMYPEDIDLSRRLFKHYDTAMYPEVQIIHRHEAASYKSFKMLWIHSINMIKYFNKWGWIFDKERSLVNKDLLQNLAYKQKKNNFL
ncbi:glycosyl transferase family 2 [Bacteroidales bacterium]|nr:glycosyl transferase family 2 [Bacteroidales bacterium]